jgi:hypothetical protein
VFSPCANDFFLADAIMNHLYAQIDKLAGQENWTDWKFQILITLDAHDVRDVVQGELQSPAVPEEGASDEERKEYETKRKAFVKANGLAMQLLTITMTPETRNLVRMYQTAKEMWDKLHQVFEQQNGQRLDRLYTELFSCIKQPTESIAVYVSRLQSKWKDLQEETERTEKVKLPVSMLLNRILNSLPAEYQMFHTVWESVPREDRTVDRLTERLRLVELQLEKSETKVDRTESALLADQKKSADKASSKGKGPKCYGCHKYGHVVKNCQKMKDSAKGKKPETKKSSEGDNWSMFSAMSAGATKGDWFVDSGASSHLSGQKNWMTDFTESSGSTTVTIANGKKLNTAGKGHVKVDLSMSGERQISNVTYVPEMDVNLLSVSALTEKGLAVMFSGDRCHMFCERDCHTEGNPVASATKVNGMYRLDVNNVVTVRASAVSAGDGGGHDLWHKRLGHMNRRAMNLLKSEMSTGIDYNNNDKGESCVACIEGKLTRSSFPKKSEHRASGKLELVHTDLCGPMRVESHNGAKYMLTFTDDFTRFSHGYFLKSKTEVLSIFKQYKALVENESGCHIKRLRSDNGTEYVNSEFQDFLSACGIKHERTVPYTPEQNGVAERLNRTIVDKARTMLKDAGLGEAFWAEASNTAIYLKNCSPTKAIRGMTPQEAWSGRKVDLNHLRVFGCVAYSHVPDATRKKWDSKGRRLLFVGYSTVAKGYRLIDPKDPKRIVISRDVRFLENTFVDSVSEPVPKPEKPEPEKPEPEKPESGKPEPDARVVFVPAPANAEVDDDYRAEEQHPADEDAEDQQRRYPLRHRRQKEYPGYMLFHASHEEVEPVTVTEALSGSNRAKWLDAMQQEMTALSDNKSWTLVDLPHGKRTVKNKWVFKVKKDADGNVERFKARLVAKGFTQQHGIDYNETFAPVVRHSTLRLLFAVAADRSLEIDHLDVVTAFLNGELTETVYMEQPEGFIVEGEEGKVCLLKKALYGLKQGSRAWYDVIHAFLMSVGFERLEHEPCVYVLVDGDTILIVALYVDDIFLFSNNSSAKLKVKQELMARFNMKDLGPAKHVLGMRVQRVEGCIFVDQQQYVRDVLDRFGMSDCRPIDTPMEAGKVLLKPENGSSITNQPYRSLVGCLMYLAVCTRPDIAHVASVLSQFNDCYSEEHWKSAKRVLRYLKGTMDYGLAFRKTGQELTGFADADWGHDHVDRRSFTGYVFKVGDAPVSWESKKQRTVALSSTEAEYMALSETTKEAVFLRNIVSRIAGTQQTVVIYNDNQSAQKLSLNQMFHNRTKHIDIRHHFVREAQESGLVKVDYLGTSEMPADVLTKALCREKHAKCVVRLGLQRCPASN